MQRLKITLAVTGLNATDNPGSGVPVIRALKESKKFDVRIIGLCYETLEPGIFLKSIVDKSYLIPLPSKGKESLLKRLKFIHSKENINIIIPNFDAELPNFIELSDILKNEMNIKTFLPSKEQFEARQKINLESFGKKHKLSIPKSKILYGISELFSISDTFNYPLVVKGKFYDASVVYSLEQAAAAYNRINAKWGSPIIIQEFIQGQEVNVTAIGDGKGNTIGAVPMRKKYVTDKGKAWSGISIDDEQLLTLASDIIRFTKWRGGMELEVIKTEKNKYYIIEINPRFPAWVYLAVGCGQNHPEALISLALGGRVKPFKKYGIGKMFVRYAFDMIVNLKDFEKITTQGEL